MNSIVERKIRWYVVFSLFYHWSIECHLISSEWKRKPINTCVIILYFQEGLTQIHLQIIIMLIVVMRNWLTRWRNLNFFWSTILMFSFFISFSGFIITLSDFGMRIANIGYWNKKALKYILNTILLLLNLYTRWMERKLNGWFLFFALSIDYLCFILNL